MEGSTEVSSITLRSKAIPIIAKAEVQTILDMRLDNIDKKTSIQYKTTYYCARDKLFWMLDQVKHKQKDDKSAMIEYE